MIDKPSQQTLRPDQNSLAPIQCRVQPQDQGLPLAEYLARECLISIEAAVDLIDFGSVQIDAHQERQPFRRLAGGERITLYWPQHGTQRVYETDPQRIRYADRYLLAYDKEAGIPSQQTPCDSYNNVYAAVQRHLQRLGSRRPYVALHQRLDQQTSGILLLALDRAVNRQLGRAFQEHRVVKDYLAWVAGRPAQQQWVARADIGRSKGRYRTCPRGRGKSAETIFTTLHHGTDRTLLWARPRTGRTHQIRLHLAAGGHPIIGDRRYGNTPAETLYLHAYRLRLLHPITGSPLVLTAAVPENWPPPHAVALPDDPGSIPPPADRRESAPADDL